MYTSGILLETNPVLVVSPELACDLKSADAALVLQQIHYWLNKNCGRVIDGVRWIYNTYASWHDQFPWLSPWKLRKTFYRLRELKILKFEQHDKTRWNQRGYYTIDYEELEALHRSMCGNATDRCDENQSLNALTAHTSIRTKNTPEISAKNTPTKERGVQEMAEEVESGLHNIPPSTQLEYGSSPLPDSISQDNFSAAGDDELKNNDSNFNSLKPIEIPQSQDLKHNRVDLHDPELRSCAKKFPDRLHTAIAAWLQWAKSENVQKPTRSLVTAIKDNWQPQLSPREQWWHAATIVWGRSKRDRLIDGVVDGWIYFKNKQQLALDKAAGMSWDELADLGGGA